MQARTYENPISLTTTPVTNTTRVYAVISENRYFIRALEEAEFAQINRDPIGRQDSYWLLTPTNEMFDSDYRLITDRGYSAQEMQANFNFEVNSIPRLFRDQQSPVNFFQVPQIPVFVTALAQRLNLSEQWLYNLYNSNMRQYHHIDTCAPYILSGQMTIEQARQITSQQEMNILTVRASLTAPNMNLHEILHLTEAQRLMFTNHQQNTEPEVDDNCCFCNIF